MGFFVWYYGGDFMRCLRCGNTENRYFYKDERGWYCRRCIMFGRVNVGELPEGKRGIRKKHAISYKLKYPLTPAQKQCAAQIAFHLQHHQDVLVYAACGAGKTELVMEAIQMALRSGKKVGFAISRRQVVLEIRERMQEAFSPLKVIAVCEGYTDVVDGDLIVCTMHQLYRYHQTFDLLVMDEVDAFPYRGNAVLKQIAMHACIGNFMYLTATPDEEMLQEVQNGTLALVELFQRPHGHPLIVPHIKIGTPSLQLLYLMQFLYKQKKEKKQTLVFVPTIAMAQIMSRWLHTLFRCTSFTSKTKDKEKILKLFHEHRYQCLIATTVLERGITIKGVHVVIYQADHPVFNEASLIQMIGRVGRNIEMPTGKGLFLCTKKTRDIDRCVRALQRMNGADNK